MLLQAFTLIVHNDRQSLDVAIEAKNVEAVSVLIVVFKFFADKVLGLPEIRTDVANYFGVILVAGNIEGGAPAKILFCELLQDFGLSLAMAFVVNG